MNDQIGTGCLGGWSCRMSLAVFSAGPTGEEPHLDVVPVTEGTANSGVLANNTLWQYNADGTVSPGTVPGWMTIPGYDMTTGLGTPWAPRYVAGLAAS
jgi:hypothetical protein